MTKAKRQIALDDLPDARVRDAVALLHFLRFTPRPPEWYPLGAPSTAIVQDLVAAGYADATVGTYYGQPILRVRLRNGRRRP